MIYLYAITEAGAAPPRGLGLEDEQLRLMRGPEISAIYSDHERIDRRPQAEALWRHEQVVEAAMEAGPTLPVRFGTTFEDADALSDALRSAGPHLFLQLERVRGCVELAVRIGLVDGSANEPGVGDGRGYLETKLAKRRRRDAIVRDTLGPLGELARSARHDEGSSAHEVARASYLVRDDQVDRFSAQVSLIAEDNPDLWLSCTGPWPPYSFAGLEMAA